MSAASAQPGAIFADEPTEALAITGLHVRSGDLEPGEAIIDRVFATVRGACDAAGIQPSDCDSVVLAADDIADGRSITTMIHATAAGAYLKDEVRVTHGGLTALGVAALRVQAGISRRSLVAGWWLPSADLTEIARTSTTIRDGSRLLVAPERLEIDTAEGACVACVVGPAESPDGLRFEGFAFGQADYDSWLSGDGEPAEALSRLGGDLAGRAELGDDGLLATSRVGDPGAWDAAIEAAALAGFERLAEPPAHRGIVDGLVNLFALEARLEPGRRGVALATGLPTFMLVEGVVVRRNHA
jgi:hypothetical protein